MSLIWLVVAYHLYHNTIPQPAAQGVRRIRFNPSGNDTLVFVHIQKTSGSYFLDCLTTAKLGGVKLCTAVDKKVRRARCPRPGAANGMESWLVSERTLGWVCGVHSSYPEMKDCLPSRLDAEWGPKTSRRLHYMTLLRHPILRYVSEYMHVRRGATWSRRRRCGKKEVVDAEMPPCYEGFYSGSPWPNVTIESFVSCDSNWANNRQTFALAKLENFGCFNRSVWKQREAQLVNSAKSNLKNMAFFGMAEYQKESTVLFEETFNLAMDEPLKQKPFTALRSFDTLLKEILRNKSLYKRIAEINHLDMQLYQYALELFALRLKPFDVLIDANKVDNLIQANLGTLNHLL